MVVQIHDTSQVQRRVWRRTPGSPPLASMRSVASRPYRSYTSRFAGSDSVSYAFRTSVNCACASGSCACKEHLVIQAAVKVQISVSGAAQMQPLPCHLDSFQGSLVSPTLMVALISHMALLRLQKRCAIGLQQYL